MIHVHNPLDVVLYLQYSACTYYASSKANFACIEWAHTYRVRGYWILPKCSRNRGKRIVSSSHVTAVKPCRRQCVQSWKLLIPAAVARSFVRKTYGVGEWPWILGFVDRHQVARPSHLNRNMRDGLPKGPHVDEKLCVPCPVARGRGAYLQLTSCYSVYSGP